ncbi:MAG: hypothetical protein ABR508_07460 [Candidatus Baltobacteraceae bacterium]
MIRRSFARLLQAVAVLLICVAGVGSTLFFTRAQDDSKPQYSDLSHLKLTATRRLPANVIAPQDGASISGAATQVTVETVNGAGVELQVNGEIVPVRNLGRMSVSKAGTTQFEYFGVLLRAGPNTLLATAIGAGGARGASQSETIFGAGPPVAIHVSMLGSLVADGKTTARLIVDAVDQWNHPAMSGSEVRVKILQGRARVGNAGQSDPAAGASPAPSAFATSLPASGTSSPQAHYVLAQGGRIVIPLTASLEPGTLQLQVAVNDITDTQSYTIAPYLRAPFVNGIISAGAGNVPAAVDGDGRYDGGGARKERLAIYANGKVGRASSLTFSYESQNRLEESSSLGPFVSNPDERPYQTYGDSSRVTSDFHSTDRLYARIDNGRNNLMWGQYTAAVGDPQGVAHYEQQISGLKGEATLGRPGQGHVMAFTAHDRTGYVAFTTPVSGLGALLAPLHPNVVIGSDVLTLVALDRRTGAAASQTPLTRNVDYTIDYATGALRFLNVPLPFDQNFNPQLLYIQYQYQGPDVKSETSGFDFRYALARNGSATFDFGYLNDASGTTNYSLATQSLSGRMPTGDWRFSRATSNGSAPTAASFGETPASRGSATSFALNEHVRGNEIAFNYQNTGAGFANPFGGFNVTGLENIQATFAHRTRSQSAFTLSLSQQRNTGGSGGSTGVEQNVVASWQAAIAKALAVTLGFQAQRETNGPGAIVPGHTPVQPVNGSSAGLQAGLQWKASRRLSVSVQHAASLGGNSQILPSQTAAEADYDLPTQGRLYVRELLGGGVSSFASSTSSLTNASLGSRSTQIGIQRTIGSTTALDTSYLIADTGNETNVYTTLGVQETFHLGKRLSGNATFESARSTGASPGGFSTLGTGLTYSDLKDFRASFSMQTRGGGGGGMTMNGGAAGHIGQNLALMGSFNETFGNGLSIVDDRISLAFRPSQNDRFISLLGLDRQSGGYTNTAGTSDILSFEEVYRPTLTTEIAGRVGYKLNGDGYYLAHSSVAGVRITQSLGARFDIAGEVRAMAAGNVASARSSDFAAEIGYKAGGARLSGGYNFSGAVDPSLTGHPQRKGLYVMVTALVDRIFGWGKP